MTLALAVLLLPAGPAAPAAAAAQETASPPGIDDLGIPSTPPWEDPGAESGGPGGPKGKGGASRHPLEEDFWGNAGMDALELERWRSGILAAAWFAVGQPQVFQPAGEGALYDEYRETARRTWARAMDHWLALDSLVGRYGEFRELSGQEERAAAFSLAYAAWLAQSRFVREWTGLCGGRAALEKLFDEPVPELGLPAGSYSRIKARFQGEKGAADRAAAWSYYLHLGGARAAARVPGVRRELFERARAEDAAAPKRTARGPARLPGREFLAGTFATVSAARAWTEGTGPREDETPSLMPPPPEWETVSISCRAVYAVDSVRHWFRMDASTAARPASLVSRSQAGDLARELEPGDILLARRGGSLSDIGLPGFWHIAGVYAGTPAERRKYFGSDELDAALKRGAPEAYAANAGTSAAAGAPVAQARPGGVGFAPLGEFAAADAVAVMRPRLGRPEKTEAIRRVFACFKKPYDHKYDVRSGAAVSGAELAARAYEGSAGLRIPLEESLGTWTVSANALVRKFDAEFGTPAQEFDWVAFLDEDVSPGGFGRARRASLEEFRGSWRRPKWALREEAEK